MFVGVDVGGTNSDAAVISEDKKVLAWAKETTTEDITSGVKEVVRRALNAVPEPHKGKAVKRISIGMYLCHDARKLLRCCAVAR